LHWRGKRAHENGVGKKRIRRQVSRLIKRSGQEGLQREEKNPGGGEKERQQREIKKNSIEVFAHTGLSGHIPKESEGSRIGGTKKIMKGSYDGNMRLNSSLTMTVEARHSRSNSTQRTKNERGKRPICNTTPITFIPARFG